MMVTYPVSRDIHPVVLWSIKEPIKIIAHETIVFYGDFMGINLDIPSEKRKTLKAVFSLLNEENEATKFIILDCLFHSRCILS
jgi:hypothetical protein